MALACWSVFTNRSCEAMGRRTFFSLIHSTSCNGFSGSSLLPSTRCFRAQLKRLDSHRKSPSSSQMQRALGERSTVDPTPTPFSPFCICEMQLGCNRLFEVTHHTAR